MGEKKVTIMVLKVNLQCSKCYKKVKKVLCKFPQIQEQFFDEKTNTVRIKVVCRSPEKIRDKLCCKGDGSIKTIEILKPPPPKPQPVVRVVARVAFRVVARVAARVGSRVAARVAFRVAARLVARVAVAAQHPSPPPLPPPPPPYSTDRPCCTECSEQRSGGPCYQPGYGRERQYDWCYGRPVYESWGGGCDNRVYYRGRCSDYICEANPAAPCTIM